MPLTALQARIYESNEVFGSVLSVAIHDCDEPAHVSLVQSHQSDADRSLVANIPAQPQNVDAIHVGQIPRAESIRGKAAIIDNLNLRPSASQMPTCPVDIGNLALERIPVVEDRHQYVKRFGHARFSHVTMRL